MPQPSQNSAYSPARPPSPHRTDTTQLVGKIVAARRLTLIRSTPRQHCLMDRLARRPLTVTAMKRPAAPGHATALDAELPPSSFVHQSITPPVSTVVDQGHVSTLTALRHRCVTTTSSCRRSPPRLGLVKRVIGLGTNCAGPGQWRIMPRSNGAAVRGSRLKIATDVAGILESSKAPAKTGPFVLIGGNGD